MTDSLVGAKVVLANSTVVNVSADENPDIFWALRGAGSSFGIVVEYQFQTFEAPESEIVFNYPIKLDGDSFVQALSALESYVSRIHPHIEWLQRTCSVSGSITNHALSR